MKQLNLTINLKNDPSTIEEVGSTLNELVSAFGQFTESNRTNGIGGTIEDKSGDTLGIWEVISLPNSSFCDECEAEIPDEVEDMVNSYHNDFCSLHPNNVIEVEHTTIGGIRYDIGDFDRNEV